MLDKVFCAVDCYSQCWQNIFNACIGGLEKGGKRVGLSKKSQKVTESHRMSLKVSES